MKYVFVNTFVTIWLQDQFKFIMFNNSIQLRKYKKIMAMFKKYISILSLILFFSLHVLPASAQKKSIAQKVDSVLRLMTLEEKIGQMNQYNDDWIATGPVTLDPDKTNQVRNGQVGSLLNCVGTARTRNWQQVAMQSRLKIPLLFGQDVIHGYKTTFPVPLAEAASWDLDAMTLSARIAATEASASGIHWTFAPMVDISRDPRWGRVMEGAGEDTYIKLIEAFAPEGLDDLPDPDRVFIGGAGGKLDEIIDVVSQRLRPEGAVVINAVTLDTLTRAVEFLEDHGFTVEATCVNIAKTRSLTEYKMFEAQNPVYVISARKGNE